VPPSIPQQLAPFYLALGAVATGWAEYEFRLNDAIWHLANIERLAGTCITSQMIGPGPRFRCLAALLELRGTPKNLISDLNSHASRAEGIGRQRNRLLHDPFLLNTERGTIVRMQMTADRHLVHTFIPTEVDQLHKVADDIDNITSEFDDLFFRKILPDTPQWPNTQYAMSEGIAWRREQED
jgi:hypothetical protein